MMSFNFADKWEKEFIDFQLLLIYIIPDSFNIQSFQANQIYNLIVLNGFFLKDNPQNNTKAILYKTKKKINFNNLKFDLSQTQTLKVAQQVRKYFRDDMSSFCILSLYLYTSICNKLKKEKLQQVQKQYLSVLTTLQKNYPANQSSSPAKNQKSGFKQIKSSYKMQIFQFKPNAQSHFKQLQNHVIQKASKAKQDLNLFSHLVKHICYQKGYGFKYGVKISNEQSKIAIFRTIQKLIQDKLDSSSKKSSFSSKTLSDQDIKNMIKQQKNIVQQNIQTLLQKQPNIKFDAKDLVRGKCTFSTIEDIIQTGNKLLDQIVKQGHQVIQIKDRLRKNTKDAVLIIKLPNSIAQLQLVLQLDVSSNQFNHKIYQLKRSKLYSPIVNLFVQNQKWGEGFFNQLNYFLQYIMKLRKIQQKSGNLYKINPQMADSLYFVQNMKKLEQYQTSLFKDCQNVMIDFKNNFLVNSQIQLQINQQISDKQMDIIDQQVKNILKLHKYQTISKSNNEKRKLNRQLNTINFDINSKNSNQLIWIRMVLKKMKTQGLIDFRVLQKLQADLLYQQQQLDESLSCYLNLTIKLNQNFDTLNSKIKKDYLDALNNIGKIYYRKKLFPQSLDYFQQTSKLIVNLKGQNSIQYALNLQKIAMIYNQLAKYPQYASTYQKCQKLIHSIKGQQSIQTAMLKSNIGQLYCNKGDTVKALQLLQKSLKFISQHSGKQSLEAAQVYIKLGMLHQKKVDYQKAENFYRQSLEIHSTVSQRSVKAAYNLFDIGRMFQKQKKMRQAVQYYRNSRFMFYAANALSDYVIILPQIIDLCFEVEDGELSEVKFQLQNCIRNIQQKRGKDSIQMSQFKLNVGLIYEKRNDKIKAIEQIEQSLAISKQKLGNNHPKTIQIQKELKRLKQTN